MKLLPALLMLPILAAAIPLRPGTSLEYLVWRSAQAKTSAVRVTVLDSTLDSSQETHWKLAIQDSLLDGGTITKDTASLLRTSSSLEWRKSSSLVDWDPLPLDSASESSCPQQSYAPQILSHIKWLPGIGWSRWENIDRWVLLKVDGKFVDTSLVPQNRLVFPINVGNSWTWDRYDSATSIAFSGGEEGYPHQFSTHLLKGALHWEILSREADSSDWLRFTVAQQQTYHSNDSTNVKTRSDTTIQAHFIDSIFDSTIALRISLKFGIAFPNLLPAQGFITLWNDSALGDGYLRKDSEVYYEFGVNSENDCSSNTYFHIESNMGLDTGYRRINGLDMGHQTPAELRNHHYDTIAVYRLLSFNGTAIRTSAIASRTAAQKHPALTIRYLRDALQDPSAHLRLIAIDGRSRELSRENWESDLRRQHGLQFLELRTSAGILRSPTVLTP